MQGRDHDSLNQREDSKNGEKMKWLTSKLDRLCDWFVAEKCEEGVKGVSDL